MQNPWLVIGEPLAYFLNLPDAALTAAHPPTLLPDCHSRAGGNPDPIVFLGDTYTTAIALVSHGCPVHYVTAIGTDDRSQQWQEEARAAGLDLAALQVIPEALLGAFAARNDSKAGFVYWRAGSAASRFQSYPPLLTSLVQAGGVYSSGVSLAVSQGFRALVPNAFETVFAQGGITAFDLNWRPRLWEASGLSVEAQQALLKTVLDRTQVLFVSFPDDTTPWLRVATLPEVLQVLQDWAAGGNRVAILKQGADGATAITQPHTVTVVPQSVLTIDNLNTIGAGDAFNAGVLSGLSHGGLSLLDEATLVALLTQGHQSALAHLQQWNATLHAGTENP